MTDPLTLALPMIQTLATMGASGSLELTSATGLHISASASYTPTSSGASASQQIQQAPHLKLPLGLPAVPSLDLTGLHGLTSALQQTGKAFGAVTHAVGSATRQIASAWTGTAAQAAQKTVKTIALHSDELEEKHAELAAATSEAEAIVARASCEIAAVIAKFLKEANDTIAATAETIIGPIIEVTEEALIACQQVADIYMRALSELQGPTQKALATAHDAYLKSDIKLPLAVPSPHSMAEIAGATLTPTLPTIKGRAKIHGHTNIDVQLGGNSFTEHVAWGQDPDVRADATTTQAPPAHTSSVAYSAGAATTYSGPTGMQTGSPSSTYSGTGGGAGAVTSAGTGAPAATSIGAHYASGAQYASGYAASSAHTSNTSDDTNGYCVTADGEVPITLPNGHTVYAPNATAATAIKSALTQVGVPYVWGGTTPGVGLYCSGLTQWAYQQAGLEIGRTTWDQDNNPQIPVEEALPGDLLIWDGHVAMFLGDGLMIEAGDPVAVTPVRTENAGMAFEGVFRPWLKKK